MRRCRLVTTATVGFVIAAGVACGHPGPAGPAPAPPPSASGLDLVGIDRGIRPQDDLYGFANGTWSRTTPIPPDEVDVGGYPTIRGRAAELQRSIVEEAAANADKAPALSDERKIGDLYASFVDTARIDQLGTAPLLPLFAAVDQLGTPADLIRHFGQMQQFGEHGPIAFGVAIDTRRPGASVVKVGQGGLWLPRDYYLSTEPTLAGIRDQYRRYVSTVFSLAGLPEPESSAAGVLDLETRLAAAHLDQVHTREDVARRFTVPAASKATGLDWAAYLAAAGTTTPELSVGSRGYFDALARLLGEIPMPTWRTYLKWRLTQDYMGYLSSQFDAAELEFRARAYTGREQPRARWVRGIAVVNTAMGDALGRIYAARAISPGTERRARAMTNTILDAYRDSITRVDWMTPATKAAALDKLARITVRIGHPTRWKDYGALEIRRDDLIGNVRRAYQLEHQRQLARLSRPAEPGVWPITPQTPNAYYYPGSNQIVISAAELQPPFFAPEADDAVNYGAIGTVIAHEVGHAFDDIGRRYDGSGHPRDWWTPVDNARFMEKTKALITQFDAYRPLPDTAVNGRLTLGENIADLGGLTLAHRAYLATLAGRPAPVLDGFTGEQRFFIAFAQRSRAKVRDEWLRNMLHTDSHSPAPFRTNGAAVNTDAFHAAFDVKPGDRLHKPADQRIHIW